MKQQLHFVTLGVNDLSAMTKFYIDCFGWQTMGENPGITFFKMNGSILGLYEVNELAEDIGIEQDGSGFKRITTAICFNSEAEVDAAFSELRSNGVKVIKEPQKVFWGGYSGYVSDPENNFWELAFNPFLVIAENGSVNGYKQ